MSRRIFTKIFTSPLTYIAGCIILAVFVVNSRVVFSRAWFVWRENNELEKKVLAIEEKNRELAEEIAYARSAGFQEREGKARLNLKRTGEEVVVIVPRSDNQASSTLSELSMWQKLLVFIGLD